MVNLPTNHFERVLQFLERNFGQPRGRHEDPYGLLKDLPHDTSEWWPCRPDQLVIFPEPVRGLDLEVLNPSDRLLRSMEAQRYGTVTLVMPARPVRWTPHACWLMSLHTHVPAINMVRYPKAQGSRAFPFCRTICENEGRQLCLMSVPFAVMTWQARDGYEANE